MCVQMKRTLVSAALLRFDGQLGVFKPHAGPAYPCYRCIFPEEPPPDLIPRCETAGIFGAVAGIMGSLQATEVLKELLGLGDTMAGRLMLYDGLSVADPHREGEAPRRIARAVASASFADFSRAGFYPAPTRPAPARNPEYSNAGDTVQPTSVQSPSVRADCQALAGTTACGRAPASDVGAEQMMLGRRRLPAPRSRSFSGAPAYQCQISIASTRCQCETSPDLSRK